MEGRMTVALISIFVCIVLVGAVIVPTIDNVSSGSGWDETITTTYNEDPDLTFDKQTSAFALNMSVTIGDDVVITNGEDTVTAPYGAMFLLAADNSAVFISVADDLIFTWSDNDGKHSLTLAGDFTAVIADDKLTINDGTAHDAPLPASYLYVPSSTGGYGSFASGELNKRAADPVIAAGSFAGAVAYNSSVTLVGDTMVMSVDGTDTLITSAEWVAAPAAEPAIVPLDPSSITIQPLDPSVIDPIDLGGGASLMSVPTPTYTDGDWGYDLITSGDNQGKAKIVSYSGAGGGPITIPATIGGYDVAEVGKDGGTYNVFNTSLSATDLIISEGIVKINGYAFYQCSGFTGSLTLPSSITRIGSGAFQGCSGFTGSLTIPNSVTNIGTSAFNGCLGFTGSLTLPSSITSINDNTFTNCRGFTGSLIIPDGVTYIGTSAFSNCRGFTGSLIIPDSVRTIANNAFNGCRGLTGSLILPNSITNIGNSAFFECYTLTSMISFIDAASFGTTPFGTTTALKEILNLGSLELTTTSYGLNADVIQDFIGADVYIAPATLTEVIHHSGGSDGMSAMWAVIPLVVVAAVLVAAAAMFISKRQY